MSSDPTGHDVTLTSAQFHILLTLAEGQRHGYGIMQEVERRTGGAVELGPGTLYRSIKQLLAADLIEGTEERGPGEGSARNRRRTYGLTSRGKARLLEETHRLRALVGWADTILGQQT